jgi:hypothetical protein
VLNNFSAVIGAIGCLILNNSAARPHVKRMMYRALPAALLALALGATAAHAGCYADYKAKKDNPLQLHYGVIELPQSLCDGGNVAAAIAPRLAREGWTLLNVLSVFDDAGLSERKASAGPFYLRF